MPAVGLQNRMSVPSVKERYLAAQQRSQQYEVTYIMHAHLSVGEISDGHRRRIGNSDDIETD